MIKNVTIENSIKSDEYAFLIAIANKKTEEFISDVVHKSNINHKRAWYLLEKWASKQWYSYGVSLDLGWLTPLGLEIAKALPTDGERNSL